MLNGKRCSARKWLHGKKSSCCMKKFKESKFSFCLRKLNLKKPMVEDELLQNGRKAVNDLAEEWNRSLEEPMVLDESLPNGWSAVSESLDHDDLANGRMMKQHFQEDKKKAMPLN